VSFCLQLYEISVFCHTSVSRNMTTYNVCTHTHTLGELDSFINTVDHYWVAQPSAKVNGNL